MSGTKSIFTIFLIGTLVCQSTNTTVYKKVRSELISFKKALDDNFQIFITYLKQKDAGTIQKEQIYTGLEIGGVILGIVTAIKFYHPVKRRWKETVTENLIKASEQGNYSGVLFNLLMGADIDAKNRDGKTPCMLAIERKNLKVMETLIKRGANLYVQDNNQNDAFYYAKEQKFTELDQLKRRWKETVTENLIKASEQGNYSGVLFNLLIGADIDAKNRNGKTPFILAIERKNLKVMETLIKRGANLYIQDDNKHDAFYYAKEQKFTELDQFINDIIENRLEYLKSSGPSETA